MRTLAKRSRTLLSDSPIHMLNSSGPLTEMKFVLASFAMAFCTQFLKSQRTVVFNRESGRELNFENAGLCDECLSIYVYIYKYTCTYTHTYVHTSISVHTYIHIHINVYVNTYIYTYTCICRYIHIYIHRRLLLNKLCTFAMSVFPHPEGP